MSPPSGTNICLTDLCYSSNHGGFPLGRANHSDPSPGRTGEPTQDPRIGNEEPSPQAVSTFGRQGRTGSFWQALNFSTGISAFGRGGARWIFGTEWGWSHLPSGWGVNLFYNRLTSPLGDLESDDTVSQIGLRPNWILQSNPERLRRSKSAFNFGVRLGIPVAVQIPHEDPGASQLMLGASAEIILGAAIPNQRGAIGRGYHLLGLGFSLMASPHGEDPNWTGMITLSTNIGGLILSPYLYFEPPE